MKTVKCVVWDLDHTLWQGVLSENDQLQLRPGVAQIVRTLDERGILQSVASKNNAEDALRRLREFGLEEYFLYPAISWDAKSAGLTRIQSRLNIGLDTFLFIDDQEFERAEVRSVHPQVRLWPAERIDELLLEPALNPTIITEDARARRIMIQADAARQEEEDQFQGPKEEFLASLNMRFRISPATPADLLRAEELTVRTNQLNSSGVTYDATELDAFRLSTTHDLLICELQDRYGTYGKIGLALVEKTPAFWRLKLALMSCRVISRGVGSILLNHLMREAHRAGTRLQVEFKPTDRNRMMFITLKFAGFHEVSKEGDIQVLEHNLDRIPDFPAYVHVQIGNA